MNIPSFHANPTESYYHEWNSGTFVPSSVKTTSLGLI